MVGAKLERVQGEAEWWGMVQQLRQRTDRASAVPVVLISWMQPGTQSWWDRLLKSVFVPENPGQLTSMGLVFCLKILTYKILKAEVSRQLVFWEGAQLWKHFYYYKYRFL